MISRDKYQGKEENGFPILFHSNYYWDIAVERPYAPAFNQQIQKAIDSKKLRWDYRFDGNTGEFYSEDNSRTIQGETDAKKWKKYFLENF